MSSYYTVSTGNKFGILENEDSDDEVDQRVMTREVYEKTSTAEQARDAPPARGNQGAASSRETRGGGSTRGGRPNRGRGGGGSPQDDRPYERRERGEGYNTEGRERRERYEGHGGETRERRDRVEGYGGEVRERREYTGEGRERREYTGEGRERREYTGEGRGGRGYRGNRQGDDEQADDNSGRNYEITSSRGRGRGGGDHNRQWNGRGREFDRRSGTGRSSNMKKGGGGGHNWGNPEQAGEGESDVLSPANRESGPDEGDNHPQKVGADEGDARGAQDGSETIQPTEDAEKGRGKEVEEPETLNLEEWKKEQQMARASLPIRGNEEHPTKTAEELQKEGYFVKDPLAKEGLEKESKREEEAGVGVKVKRQSPNVYQDLFGNGARRGRRGGRGQEPSKAYAGGRPYPSGPPTFELHDSSQFPALGV